jgi:BirA family transcriptional regulator, biotin operon repressor / biotin---[acetyl-CoA-carboxylase] ligase
MRSRLRIKDVKCSGLARLGTQVEIFDQIDSTNEYLLNNCEKLPDGAIAAAEWQRAGRGQFRRPWISPPRLSILLSVLLHELADTRLLTEAAILGARCAADAIKNRLNVTPELCPPNDLLLRGRKIAGVLAETRPLADGRRAVVIGIGINVNHSPSDFPPELPIASSLKIECGKPVQRRELTAELVRQLDRCFSHL